MIIFLYGEDSYRSKNKLDEIIKSYKSTHKSGLNLVFLDVLQCDFNNFYDIFRSSSMFQEKKLVILKNFFSDKLFQEKFLNNLREVESFKDVIIIYETDSVDERLKSFKILNKECKGQEFKLFDSKKLKIWTQKEFEALNQKINNDALDVLLNFVGNDLWRLSSEIKKLSDYKNGLVVKREDVVLLVRERIENDIFKTIDALASKNKKQALEFLQKHLDGGDNPLYILSMIAYQFRNLLLIKELAGKGLMYSSIVKKSGLHPFVVKKNYFACSKFSFEELKYIYKKIFQIDFNIKTGKIDSELALDLLVSRI